MAFPCYQPAALHAAESHTAACPSAIHPPLPLPPPPSLQDEDIAHFFSRVEACRSLWAALQAAAREAAPQGVQVVYTVIQSLTADGRDRGLDYKLSGFHVPPGSWDAEVGCT